MYSARYSWDGEDVFLGELPCQLKLDNIILPF